MTRLKLAELTSGVGALVLGLGLGAMFPQWLGRTAALITVAGLVLHGFGMWDKHRLEAGQATNSALVAALYWVCWVLLAAVLATLFFWHR